jgi:glycosyltransferase involved in cell wall biosynthesis
VSWPGVLIDVTRLVHRFINKRLPTGVDRVSLAYIRHYGVQARAVLRHKGGKFVFRRAESATLFDWLLALGTTGSPMATIYKGLITGCLAQQVKGSVLFNTGHSGLESDGYVTMLRQQQVQPVFMLHDLIPIEHPEFCRDGEQERHLVRLRNAVQVASAIVCNSQATLDALRKQCVQAGWTVPPAAVALLAPDLPDAATPLRPVVEPYFVFVSTIEPRKNHLMILRVWQKLILQMGKDAPRLILIGQRGWAYGEVTDLLAQSEVLQARVSEISACTDAQMVNYLQHAQALLFPSFAEGYGMPVVEALAQGLPVIASDLPVFREFAARIPEYLSVTDEAGWVEAIADYAVPDSARRQAQRVRMQGFMPPTWADHFAVMDRLLDEVALDA